MRKRWLALPVLLLATPLAAADPESVVSDNIVAYYRISGAKALRPLRMSDDGTKTYIEWSEQQLLPAVLAIDELKKEEVVDGYMRNGVYTIDRVYGHLVFRIDDATAHAKRLTNK